MSLSNLYPRAARLAPIILVLAGLPLPASVADDRIEAAARDSYNFKTYLKDDRIQVTSRNGVVTLTGTASEDFHKALARETVAGLPGVKGVVDQIEVRDGQPAERSDAWITTKVKAALAFHRNVSAADTAVETRNGTVVLTGKAYSPAQRELTAEYAKNVDGVTAVRNELVVTDAKPPMQALGETIDDASITAQVKTSLLFHKATRALATKVKTRHGAVTLRGQARDSAERDLVSKLAEDVHGVKKVNNHMTVKPS